MDRCKMNG
jgi:hypothetical protein